MAATRIIRGRVLCMTFLASVVVVEECHRIPRGAAALGERTVARTAESDVNAIGCHPDGAPMSQRASETADVEMAGHQVVGRSPDDMVLIKGGAFLMGTDQGLPIEGPQHPVTLKPYWIDRHEVTVAQFTEFVKATGYKTDSESIGWSGVFNIKSSRWERVDGADWHHPEGPQTAASPDDPVTHVSWDDATAYTKWAGRRLPTEAEFEYAARGGLTGKRYAWGDELSPRGKYLANYWQGTFPEHNSGRDGFSGRAPVGSFPPNGYGLYDMTGNVWEWCSDWFGEDYYQERTRANPQGPASGHTRVIRGGSWLCSSNYCAGYRVAARNHTAPDSGMNNLGFRCARDE
jgi:sulfatase modifying factor 1